MSSKDADEKTISDIVQSLRSQFRDVLSDAIPAEIESLLQALEEKEAAIANAATKPDSEARGLKSDRNR